MSAGQRAAASLGPHRSSPRGVVNRLALAPLGG